MELLQLRYFYESAQNENFSHTARAHLVPPSAVSLSVKRLEKELGVTLFIREGNRIRLSDQGRRLRRAVGVALQSLDDAIRELSQQPVTLQGDVSLCIRCHRSTLTGHIAAFKQRHPSVTFRVSHNFGGGVAGYDLVVDDDTADYPGLVKVPLARESLRFAAAADSPLAGRALTWEELRQADIITMSRATSLRRITERVYRQAGLEPRVIIECDDPYYLRQYVRQGLGITLLPEASWKNDIDDSIALLHTPVQDVYRTVCLYHRSIQSPAAAAFCQALQQQWT